MPAGFFNPKKNDEFKQIEKKIKIDENELISKKISELTKDVTEFLDHNLKLSFKSDKVSKKYA